MDEFETIRRIIAERVKMQADGLKSSTKQDAKDILAASLAALAVVERMVKALERSAAAAEAHLAPSAKKSG